MNAVETLKLIGRPNAYYPKLAKPLGGVGPAVLFSQLFYWQDKATSDLGVYKTRDELEEETGLSHNEQRTAIKKLKQKGVLIVTEKRLEHKTFYKIDNEKVNQVLSDFANSITQSSRQIKSSCPELYNVDVETTTKSSSLYQENTTKTTTDIIADKSQKTKRACQLPDEFKPNEHHRDIAMNENVNLDNEFVKFRDYCLANGKKYIDWNAAFNNWLRNAGGYKKTNKQPAKFMTLAERNRAVLESMRS
jgi:DNA-binding transcriptional regulator GbsR (MarR family)